MNFDEARAYLKSRQHFRVKVGTRNIRAVAAELGHPERRFPAVIVAGTNGKGSTVAILDSVLRALGLRVGRFTSPHLVSVKERIRIGGRELDEREFADQIAAVARAAAGLPLDHQPSFFETITAAAFVAFARFRVQAAVFEVGMGGRWDATTATDAPLGLIARIALDHERYLGRTVAEIAAEKGAVARPGGELIAGVQAPEALSVLRESAFSQGAAFRDLAAETVAEFDCRRSGSRGRLRTPEAVYEDLWLPLPGRHQVENLALAVRGAERFCQRRGLLSPDPARVREGVAAVRWPGRLEWLPAVRGRPRLLLDAAHNPSGAARLAGYLASLARGPRRVLVFGVMRDKRAPEMLATLVPEVDRVVFTQAESRRARPTAELAELAASLAPAPGPKPEGVPEVAAALERGFRLAGPSGEVVVAGSIYLLGDVLRILRERDDPSVSRPGVGELSRDEREPMPLQTRVPAA